jgi:hypothetical protein
MVEDTININSYQQPFQSELPQNFQVSQEGKKAANVIIKIITFIIGLGVSIISLPFVFCALLMGSAAIRELFFRPFFERATSTWLITSVLFIILIILFMTLMIKRHYFIALLPPAGVSMWGVFMFLQILLRGDTPNYQRAWKFLSPSFNYDSPTIALGIMLIITIQVFFWIIISISFDSGKENIVKEKKNKKIIIGILILFIVAWPIGILFTIALLIPSIRKKLYNL